MRHAPGRAFDWAMREVSMPSESAQAELREAFLAVVHDDHTKAVRTLERAWPEGARWLSGEAYLRTLGWRAPDDFGDDDEAHDAWVDGYDGPELMELLYQRLLHATHRIYRDVQVRRVLDPASPQRIRTYTHALLNRDGDFRGDPCGLGVDKIISIEEALALMQQPAHHHPVCRCTVDPFPITSTDRAKLQTALRNSSGAARGAAPGLPEAGDSAPDQCLGGRGDGWGQAHDRGAGALESAVRR